MAATTSKTAREPGAVALPDDRPRPYRIPVDLYERMVESGVFGDTSPIFLWKGQLVLPMTKGPDHEFVRTALAESLVRLATGGWHVRYNSPVEILETGVPEPDLAILRGENRDYKRRTPEARDVAVAIEVSDSSLRFDSGEKLHAYASAAIPVYWVVNIPDNRIDVYTGPTGPSEQPTYTGQRQFGPDEEVPVVLDGREVGRITVRDVLP